MRFIESVARGVPSEGAMGGSLHSKIFSRSSSQLKMYLIRKESVSKAATVINENNKEKTFDTLEIVFPFRQSSIAAEKNVSRESF